MQKFLYPNFNPDLTLLGGQAFNWEKDGEFYYGVFTDRVLKVKYEDDYLFWESSRAKSSNEDSTVGAPLVGETTAAPVVSFENEEKFIKTLLDTGLNYENVLKEIIKDKNLIKPVEQFKGLRILKQPFEQTLISFVISQNSNIPKIKRSLNLLSKLVGRKIVFDKKEFSLFPTLTEVCKLKIEDLLSTGIGYRAKYLKSIAEELRHQESKNQIPDKFYKFPGMTNYFEARNNLIKLQGIGPKVADCILVFGLHYRNITPIDLWARRAFVQTFSLDPKIKYGDLLAFIQEKFGENTAYAGQFLFEYFRINNLK